MEILWEELKFWNIDQMLVCRWFDEDASKISSITFLEKQHLSLKQKELLRIYKEFKEESIHTNDKYLIWINKTKMDSIMQEIIVPMIKSKREYYEKYYKIVIVEKRNIAVKKIKNYLIKKKIYNPDKPIIPPF